MPVTEQQRRFNSHRGGALTVSMSNDRRMSREAEHGRQVQERLIREAQRNPVTNAAPPNLPQEFISESIAKLQIHVGRGHWEQAKACIDEIERLWEVRKVQGDAKPEQIDATAVIHWHVAEVFTPRTANLIETLCNGTIGALLEIFPAKFIGCPNAGTVTVKNIARQLVRFGVIEADDAQRRIDEYDAAMQRRSKVMAERRKQ